MTALLLRDGEVDGRPADVLVADGRVTEVGPHLDPSGPHDVLEVAGGAILPGLHDHHVHLLSLAASDNSLDLSPAAVGGALGVEAAIRRAVAAVEPGGWVRATGYPSSNETLDRQRLDALAGPVPVRVQDATGALWILNSAALALVATEGDPRLDDAAAERGWVLGGDDCLGPLWPAPSIDLAAVGQRLANQGITGVTDATPFAHCGGVDLLAAAVADGSLCQHVAITGHPLLAGADPLRRGPAKVVIEDHALPELNDLVALIHAAHGTGRPVAVHCVTAEALALLLAAWDAVGAWPSDRVEHGAVIPEAALPVLARLGVTVVTQPNFVAERGDRYLAEVDAVDRPDLWRCGSLLTGGVRVAAGTDAPFGRPDPWRAMAAAVERRTAAGAVLGSGERIAPARALDLFLGALDDPGGPPRRVELGARADLCILDRPRADALADLAAVDVATTLVTGQVVSG